MSDDRAISDISDGWAISDDLIGAVQVGLGLDEGHGDLQREGVSGGREGERK